MNKAILVGRLTADPELKSTPSGLNVCSFTIAVDRRFAKEGEERKADFINCVAWRQTAEFISKYFSKGRMLGLIGSIQTRTWTDNEGKNRYATEVLVDEAYFTESKGNGNSGASEPAAKVSENDFMPTSMSEDDLPF